MGNNVDQTSPQEILSNSEIVQVAAGSEVTAVLKEDGKVYTIGFSSVNALNIDFLNFFRTEDWALDHQLQM